MEKKNHNWGIKWTAEEDEKLVKGIHLHGDSDWIAISQVVGTRGPGNNLPQNIQYL